MIGVARPIIGSLISRTLVNFSGSQPANIKTICEGEERYSYFTPNSETDFIANRPVIGEHLEIKYVDARSHIYRLYIVAKTFDQSVRWNNRTIKGVAYENIIRSYTRSIYEIDDDITRFMHEIYEIHEIYEYYTIVCETFWNVTSKWDTIWLDLARFAINLEMLQENLKMIVDFHAFVESLAMENCK